MTITDLTMNEELDQKDMNAIHGGKLVGVPFDPVVVEPKKTGRLIRGVGEGTSASNVWEKKRGIVPDLPVYTLIYVA